MTTEVVKNSGVLLILVFSGCVGEMRNLGKSNQICDGVVDCPDFSDELYCPYCPEHNFHCRVGKMCVPKDKMEIMFRTVRTVKFVREI